MNRYRKASARLLLAVFLSMTVLQCTHIHGYHAGVACAACEHHIVHAAHLSVGDTGVDSCVLCQFLHLPYLIPAVWVLAAVLFVGARCCRRVYPTVCLCVNDCRMSRAPPYDRVCDNGFH